MSKRITNLSLGIVACVLTIPIATKVTVAQDSEAQTPILDQIVITAQRREQNINDVGISVAAFSAESLKRFGIKESYDIAAYTPGLNMVSGAGYSGKINFTLRGVGINTLSEPQEAGVAIYQDDIYLAPLIGSVVGGFDLERVEVLRGPQGTLFGRSATGGLVHYISKKPSDNFEGNMAFQTGAYDEYSGELAIGGPVSDQISGRISGYWRKNDGWLKNTIGPDQIAEESYAARGQLLFSPSDNLEILLRAEHGELNNENGIVYLGENVYRNPANNEVTDLPATLDPDPFGLSFFGASIGAGNDFTGFRDTDGDFFTGTWATDGEPSRNDIDRSLLSAVLTWDLGAVTLTSITGYLEANKDYLDVNNASAVVQARIGQITTSDQLVQEIHLTGGTDNFRWTAGAFYFDFDLENTESFFGPNGLFPELFPPGFIFSDPFSIAGTAIQNKQSVAGFGQIEYDFAKKFTAIVGLRYEQEEVDFDFLQVYTENPGVVLALLGGQPPIVFNEALNGSDAVIDESYVSGTLGLDWRPDEDTLVYLSARRGIKPGVFNTPVLTVPSTEMRVKEETLHAYELGTKMTFHGGKAQLNGAVFYYDYNDYQAVFLEGAAILLTNADAEIYGLDLEFVSKPKHGLDLGIGISLLDGTVKDIGFNSPTGPVIRDREVPNMPKYTLNAMARYEWPGFGGMVSVQGDVRVQDQVYFEVQNFSANTADAYTVANFRAAWAKDGYEIAAFVKNLWNEEYEVYIQDNVDFGGYKSITPGKPRWWGIEVSYAWGR